MDKLDATSPESHSADILTDNIQKLKALFPELVTEGFEGASVNVDILKALVGDKTLTDCEEKYGLNWYGKRAARELALSPSTGTLRPCPEDSVDWDTTQNLMIEGDNLEVLKLLQKSYAGKVKLIYIDPPYNTGKDFVYPDNFQDNIKNYLELTGKIEGGKKIEANSEASGRYHTDWLNMMYPRLNLAKNLLRNDGIIFISIDDGEAAALRELMDNIFGEERFIAQIIWKSRISEDTRSNTGVSTDHEYILCYSKTDTAVLRGSEKDIAKFSNPDHDPRGPWRSADLTGLATKDARPNLHYDLINPITGIIYKCPFKGWRFEKSNMERKIAEGRIIFPSAPEGRPRHKLFINEIDDKYKNISSVFTSFSTADGTKELSKLGMPGVFSFPKPTALIKTLVEQIDDIDNGIIIDFFAGSGTTGHAVLQKNSDDNGKRHFILVQLPELLDSKNKDHSIAIGFCQNINKPLNIAELTKERLRRAGKKIAEETPLFKGDLGFRVFKLDSSNIRAWDPSPSDLETALLDSVEHIKTDRSEADVLYELLLKLGLDLATPIETKIIAGKEVHAIGVGSLFACLADHVSRDEVEALALGIVAWRQELNPVGEVTCVFRDSGFEDNVAKTNLSTILQQNGIGKVRSL